MGGTEPPAPSAAAEVLPLRDPQGSTPHATAAQVDSDERLEEELAGLDRLELALPAPPSRARSVFRAVWPRATAIILAVAIWQLVVWSGWKPSYALPGPGPTFRALWDDRHVVGSGALTTLRRAVEFYAISLVLGTILALLISRNRTLRTAVNPLIAGLQTMPSVAWVPFAIIVFGDTTQSAILFVTLLGTVPAITIGTLSGIDAIPPVLLRAGDILGAKGLGRYRYVVLPAALPGYVAGMKQGWAFSWRSLMAGELIVTVEGTQSLGRLLSAYQDQSMQADVMATMVVILVIGLVMDSVVFSNLERHVLQRRGLATGR
jgi:NitT/TauT family transport system permease protein